MTRHGTPDGRHSVSVAGVVMDEQGRALLAQRRDNGHWEAPGGILEQDEDIITGVRGEVHEETGLWVTPVGLTGVYKNMSRGIIALVFRCEENGGTLTPSKESMAFLWATAEKVLNLGRPVGRRGPHRPSGRSATGSWRPSAPEPAGTTPSVHVPWGR
ncbi:NUDIX hydrolase [Actinomadura sp. LOL_016]|uniref:NUDIX hydrolase n=1 Tax=unclassified Actinomadura TaxID=2626254 RepID=UPI003A7F8BB1